MEFFKIDMNKMLCIILVNYNSSEHTIECVKSIQKSEYDNYEIIIVDNNSNNEDKSNLQLLSDDATIIYNSDNEGFATANNIGIKYAIGKSAEYVLLLNNDTIIEPSTISCLIDAYENNEQMDKIAIITGKINYYYDRNRLWYAGGDVSFLKGDIQIYQFNEIDDQRRESILCTFASGCFMLIPKPIFASHYLPEQYFLYYEDVDFCNTLREEGYLVLYVSDARIFHKESASTGKKSNLYAYYFVRNRFLFIHNNIRSFYKCSAYLYTTLSIIKRILLGILPVRFSIFGFIDYCRGRSGKCKIIN